MRNSRLDRILYIQQVLVQGGVLNKQQTADRFGVSEKTIQRDLDTLRSYFADSEPRREILYNSTTGGYLLDDTLSRFLTSSEILAVCKILLESRSLPADDMLPILDKLIDCAVPPENQRDVRALVANEKLHYIPPHHGQHILDTLWTLGQAVRDQRVIEVAYQRMKDPQLVKRRMQPVGIMFSEYYFYLTAFLEDKTDFDNPDDLFPTIYRIDRIKSVKVLNEHFRVPYAKRFEEGEFRKRVQFMYGGKLEHIRFRYTGPSLEAVLDRLPTAQVIKTEETGWLISAEVFGKGIDMWLRSQGAWVEKVE